MEHSAAIKAGLHKHYEDNGKTKTFREPQEMICEGCGTTFLTRERSRRFCSPKCATRATQAALVKDPVFRQKMSERMKKADHRGWKVRRGMQSYPEKFWENILIQNGITGYIKERCITKKELGSTEYGNYFLDFYFEELSVDLEIDGKQHKLPERALADSQRDALLTNYGIHVIRVPWLGISTDAAIAETKILVESTINTLKSLLIS